MTTLLHHDNYRIALYYVYIEITDTDAHLRFQKDICTRLQLTGRIRVAHEGINGVLSGRIQDLQEYETELVQEIASISLKNFQKSDLDLKYCQLRTDLTVEEQLFANLIAKKTKTVIGLVDLTTSTNGKKRTKAKRTQSDGDATSDSSALLRRVYQRAMDQLRQRQPHPQGQQELGVKDDASSIQVPHLSPSEWDASINELSSQPENSVVLLDCRNVYESNVGHFRSPNARTMLTNTRKFSELAHVMVEQSEQLSQSTHIFAYCTGGVRCESATVFLKELLHEKYPHRPLPQVYQLWGGIQRYLENTNAAESLYKGKNFVFDPRRVDPTHGNDAIVGRCQVCHTPHDDYDNGKAPLLDQASRCWNCRVLILVCNDCRSKVSCWGEKEDEGKETRPKMYCGGPGQSCWHHPSVQVVTTDSVT